MHAYMWMYAWCMYFSYLDGQMLKIEWKVPPKKKEWLGEFQGLKKKKNNVWITKTKRETNIKDDK